ncbi:yrdC domain-containing protein, mitochondrial [Ceratina calcarata]|uniref:Threonylcarbamoyl-AMP synthase n=1 Tax=Ceratina calcarata TaxID=156304 RepID=A0AAJ7JDN7_9HYME|nr:yrdC domain-containing protein, mitochondrial [Ceratina calcarata]
MSAFLDGAAMELDHVKGISGNHWICKGKRSVAIAATLLQRNEIIAIPTDTIYGLAGLASSDSSIERLYAIKNRDRTKPLSICVGRLSHIERWAVVDHLPRKLLSIILPGPYTIVLRRTPALNPALNPNHETVGIRIPNFKFIHCVSEITGPLALTSANLSSEDSCLFASEFEHLWPKLGGVFHDCDRFGKSSKKLRTGSTIVDLSEPNRYKIIRYGVGAKSLIKFLHMYGIREGVRSNEDVDEEEVESLSAS